MVTVRPRTTPRASDSRLQILKSEIQNEVTGGALSPGSAILEWTEQQELGHHSVLCPVAHGKHSLAPAEALAHTIAEHPHCKSLRVHGEPESLATPDPVPSR